MEICHIFFFVYPIEISLYPIMSTFFSFSFTLSFMGSIIHYIISTNFSPFLLLYQLYVNTRLGLEWPMTPMSLTFLTHFLLHFLKLVSD